MSRRFVDDIRADIDANLADNNTGDISPIDIRESMQDMCDSLTSDQAVLGLTTASPGFSVNTGWTVVNVFDESSGDDSAGQGFLNIDQGAGTITTHATPGFSYRVLTGLSMEGTLNDRYDMTVLVDGVPAAYTSSVTGEGPDDPVGMHAEIIIGASTASSAIACAIRAESAGTIEILDCTMHVSIVPTNNP